MGCTYRPRLLPGTPGWQARRPPNAGAQTDPPVPCSAVHTFRSPYARRFFRAASPRSPPVPWPSPYRKGLGSASFHPQNGGTRHDAAGFFTIRTACSLDPQRGPLSWRFDASDLSSRRPPATRLLGHYRGRTSPRQVEHSFQDALPTTSSVPASIHVARSSTAIKVLPDTRSFPVESEGVGRFCRISVPPANRSRTSRDARARQSTIRYLAAGATFLNGNPPCGA